MRQLHRQGCASLRAAGLSLLLATLVSGAAFASEAENVVSLQAGAAQMRHVYNGLSVPAADLALQWRRSGGDHAFVAQVEWLHFMPTDTSAALVGGRVGWSYAIGDLPVEPFGGIALGVYAADVAPVLPIGFVGLGVRKRFGRLVAEVAVDGMGSLFAIGINPRIGIGYAL